MANKNLQNGFIIGKALGGVNVVTPQPVLDSLIATENRRYTPESGVDGFDEVVVNVPQQIKTLENLPETKDTDIVIVNGIHYLWKGDVA